MFSKNCCKSWFLLLSALAVGLVVRLESFATGLELSSLGANPLFTSVVSVLAYTCLTPSGAPVKHLALTWQVLAHARSIQAGSFEYGPSDGLNVSSMHKKKKNRKSSPKPKDDTFNMIKYRYARYGNPDNCGKRKRNLDNRRCFRKCDSDADCRGSKRRCLCDGECGLSCIRITTACTEVGDFQNGLVTYSPDNYFNSQLIYECNPGFTLVGNKQRTCEGDGWWSGTSPKCVKESFCPIPPIIPNAIPNIEIGNQTRYRSSTEVEYQCDIGYKSNDDGGNKIVCLEATGKWSELRLRCTRINCGQPDELENGVVKTSQDFTYSSVIEYRCHAGYRMRNGDHLRECGLDGKWSGRKPICDPIDCGEPPTFEFTISNYTSTLYKGVAQYRCLNDNYYLTEHKLPESNVLMDPSSVIETSRLECMSNGRWATKPIKCNPKYCKLDSIEYSNSYYDIRVMGEVSAQDSRIPFVYPIHTRLRISCKPSSGYELVHVHVDGDRKTSVRVQDDQAVVSCKATSPGVLGSWSDQLPICKLEEIYCPFISLPQNGVLLNINKQQTLKGYLVNTTVEFACMHGYRLVGSNTHFCEPNGKWSGKPVTCVLETTTSTTTTTTTTTPTTRTTTRTTAATTSSTTTKSVSQAGATLKQCPLDRSTSFELLLGSGRGSKNGQEAQAAPAKFFLTDKFVFVNLTSVRMFSKNRVKISLKRLNQTEEAAKSSTAAPAEPPAEVEEVDYYYEEVYEDDYEVDENGNPIADPPANEPGKVLPAIGNGQSVRYYCKQKEAEKQADKPKKYFMALCDNGQLKLEFNCNEQVETSGPSNSENEKPKNCLPPPKLVNGYNKYSSTAHGSKALYQCFNGYELSTKQINLTAVLKCMNGEWVGVVPACIKVNCGFPGILKNGRILYIGTLGEYTYQPYMTTVGQNKQIKYSCDKGFKLSGPSGSTCINGHWKPSVDSVKCVKDNAFVEGEELEEIAIDADGKIENLGQTRLLKNPLIKAFDQSSLVDERESESQLLYERLNNQFDIEKLPRPQETKMSSQRDENDDSNKTFVSKHMTRKGQKKASGSKQARNGQMESANTGRVAVAHKLGSVDKRSPSRKKSQESGKKRRPSGQDDKRAKRPNKKGRQNDKNGPEASSKKRRNRKNSKIANESSNSSTSAPFF